MAVHHQLKDYIQQLMPKRWYLLQTEATGTARQ